MFRMKGITPIISIIVLLLIMVALAGAAWTYISGFMGAYTTKVVDIPPGSSYFDGRNVKIMLRNIGTSAINTSSCTVNNNNTATCGDITITREGSTYDVDIRPSAAIISPKGSITITDYNCQAGNVKYVISSPSSTYQVNVNANTMCSFDPISWWKFDGDAKDSVGSNHGTPYGGVSWVNDATRGQIASFGGVNDYVNAGSPVPASLQVSTALTLSAWIKPSANGGGYLYQIVGCQYETSGLRGYTIFVDGRTTPVGKIHFQIGDGINWHAVENPANGDIVPLNEWTHIVAVWSSGNQGRVYFNGVLDDAIYQNTWSGSVAFSTGQEFSIGRQSDSGRHFNGLIDDVMIFKRALSPEEIKAIYNSQKK